jgi:hypothetical protein
MRTTIRTGVLATVAAMAATALGAALARGAGVDFVISDAGDSIPVSGVAFVTGVFSLVGVAIAAALRRWSARPATLFVRVAASLTALSLVPPVLAPADAGTTGTLVVLHLVAAAVMIPPLARSLGQYPPSGGTISPRMPSSRTGRSSSSRS